MFSIPGTATGGPEAGDDFHQGVQPADGPAVFDQAWFTPYSPPAPPPHHLPLSPHEGGRRHGLLALHLDHLRSSTVVTPIPGRPRSNSGPGACPICNTAGVGGLEPELQALPGGWSEPPRGGGGPGPGRRGTSWTRPGGPPMIWPWLRPLLPVTGHGFVWGPGLFSSSTPLTAARGAGAAPQRGPVRHRTGNRVVSAGDIGRGARP